MDKVVEVYAQFIEKSLQKENGLAVGSIIQKATERTEEGLSGAQVVERELK